MTNKKDLQYSALENAQEINLNSLFKKLKRNILFILSITTLSTFYSIYYASIQKPIYKGQFQILVRDEDEEDRQDITSRLANLPRALGVNSTNSFKETQALILTSPMVLNPIYKFARTEYKKRNDNVSKLTYDKWFRKNISFKYVEGSDVVELTFIDSDKKLILTILNMISEKYKKYSKEEYNKNLNRELDYLKNQEKIYVENFENSFKKNNDFIVENNLYYKGRNNYESNLDNFSFGNSRLGNIRLGNSSQNNRSFDQFSLLDDYKARKAKYSAMLKPNSKFLKDLDFQIAQLGKSIKPTTKILLQKEFLEKSMLRDEITLENIKNQIIFNELALAKQKDPWELISIPTVNEQKLSPIKRNIAFTFFFLSFFISSLFSLIKEVYIGKIDDFDIIKSTFKANFVNKTPKNLSPINVKLLDSNIEKIISKNNEKESKNLAIYYQNANQLISDFIDRNKNLSYLDILDLNIIEEKSNILFFLESGKVTYDQINKLNKYVDLYKEKNFYWIYLDNE